MDDEDIGGAGRHARNINEVDVILGEGHDGAVITPVRGSLDVVPAERGAGSGSQGTHVKAEEFALRHGI